MSHRIVVLVATLLLLVSTELRAGGQVPIDQMPMYGGMDRSATPGLKAGDAKLIEDTTKHFGTREKASTAFVNNGFAYYQRDDLVNAMRRFNQAWLLNPQNPEVFAGFGSVLHDKGENCEAMTMMEKAIALDPHVLQGIYPDAARLVTLCAVSDKDLAAEARSNMLERSESLYQKAEEIEPNKPYVYGSWATAYYWRGQYSDAWAMVAKERAAGGKPDEAFLDLLREEMPEPGLR